jgi:hypothetical protein
MRDPKGEMSGSERVNFVTFAGNCDYQVKVISLHPTDFTTLGGCIGNDGALNPWANR